MLLQTKLQQTSMMITSVKTNEKRWWRGLFG